MKLIVNSTNLVVGGGVQVAASIIEEFKKFSEDEFLILLSARVKAQIDISSFPWNFHFATLDSPAFLRSRGAIVKKMSAYEQEFAPDAVFTVFGPSYWQSRSVQICGFALPWLINPESPAHGLLKIRQRLKNWLIKKYKWWHFQREADYIWCETADVKLRLQRFLGFTDERILVVSNSHSAHFSSFSENSLSREPDGVFKILMVSSYYPHKNIEIIKRVIPYLQGKIVFQFLLTIPHDDYERIFSEDERHYVKTVGSVLASDCPQLYADTDVVFLPSLMECFSANYPEAMVMKRPILTSNLGFATSVLGDAALYFDPLDPREIADKIILLHTNADVRLSMVSEGSKRLAELFTPAERAEQLLAFCRHASSSQPRQV